MDLWEGLQHELEQARDEGLLVDDNTIELVKRTIAMPDGPEKVASAAAAFTAVAQSPRFSDRNEPNELQTIQSLAPGNTYWEIPSKEKLYQKVLGGWLGRCAGCLLGKPLEGWKRREIVSLARDTENYPITRYFTSNVSEDIAERYPMKGRAWVDKSVGMPEDDDTNYTLIGLRLLEKSGRQFTPQQVAERWLNDLPIHHTFTAERVAYRNLVMGMKAEQSAAWCNPYREWIGAQIRADIFGYVNPARTREAAAMAWRDASISHVRNGIYGEMWVAGMLAAAFVLDDPKQVILAGLAEIPPQSRLYEAIQRVLGWHSEGISWLQALDRIHQHWDENNGHHWCHTISNALIVATALLFGQRDFTQTLSIAVLGALDTDCNGATAGSVLGVMLGAEALPDSWISPLQDTLHSGVDGMGAVSIAEMAKRTLDCMA